MPSRSVSRRRLTHADRRQELIRAALRVFASRGFHGTTTRDIAQAAGVSEALIFRHFPSKERLYEAMQEECCSLKHDGEGARLRELSPGAATLVELVRDFMDRMLTPAAEQDEIETQLHRLLAHSYMEDGAFARQFMRSAVSCYVGLIEASVKAAEQAGDLVATPVRPEVGAWLVEHLASMLMLNLLPPEPVVDFRQRRAALVEQATWFGLLGLGLRPDVIRRLLPPSSRRSSKPSSTP